MLTTELSKKIQEFVSAKPRTIQEIAQHIQKNWRTADAYVERIARETGTIATRIFRGGTKGALKIAYFQSPDSLKGTAVQERLLEEISRTKKKEDFSAFDIYQYVPLEKKEAFLETQEDEPKRVFQPLIKVLRSAQKQVLIFSGNFSWAHLEQDGVNTLEVLGELSKRGVSVKIICNVDLFAFDNVGKALQFNKRLGNYPLELRHAEQPLRGIIIDDKVARFKEKKKSQRLAGKQTFVFYVIQDSDWVEWLQKVFWSVFSGSISAEERIKELKSIERIRTLK